MATQAERRLATRTAIDNAADDLFGSEGFAATTVDEIVARANVAKGAFYHHYSSKEEVFTQVLERTQVALAKECLSAAVAGKTPIERIRHGVRAYIKACGRPAVRQVLLVDGPAVLGWMKWRSIDAKYFGELTRRGVAQALGPRASRRRVDALTHLLMGAFAEAALVTASASNPQAVTEDLMAAINVILQGIEGSRSRPG